MAARLYFVNNTTNTAVAYDFDGNRQSSDDISLGTGNWQGGVATSDRLFVVNNTSNTAVAYDHDGNRQSSDDISLGTATWIGAIATSNRLFFINDTSNTAVAYDHDGNRQSSDDISLGSATWTGAIATSTRIYFLNHTTAVAVAYDHDGNRQSSDDISHGIGTTGGAATSTRIYFVNTTTNTAVAYDHDGTRQSGDDISLGAGNWRGGATTPSQATITLTTDDTDIRNGESVDFDITSDIDITDLAQADITVTGGTIVSLTETDAQNFVLRVTPTAAGTMTIEIPEDAVTPGNAAVSQDFTVNARISASITFDETELETDGTTEVTVTLSETPDSNLASSGLTASAGTLSGFSGSGRTYTATLTAPSSGSGTITVSLAADAVEAGGLGNLEVEATIDYAPPPLVATTLEIVSGNNQTAQVGTALANPLVVRVLDRNGDPFSGTTVNFSTTGGTLSNASVMTDANGRASVTLTLPATAGDYTVTASATGLTDVTFTATATPVPLTVVITGTTTIQQGAQTTLTATVTDDGGNTVQGAVVAFSAGQGSFSQASVTTDANGQASIDYTADFTDTDDVDVVITASATLAANPNPTVSSATLTSLQELGIENIVANLLITSTGDISPGGSGAQAIYQAGVVGTAHPDSDPDVNSEIQINRIRWSPSARQIILNRSGAQAWSQWDDTHGELSLFVITQSGVYHEYPVDEVHAVGGGFINWNLPDIPENSAFLSAMGDIDTGDTLLIGFGDSDSIGIDGNTGSGMVTVTAEAVTLVPTTVVLISGNNQNAPANTALPNPFVVQVNDQNGDALPGVTVRFETSDGTFSETSVITDSNGRASSTLTLSSANGLHVATAQVQDVVGVTFTATATPVATTLQIASGNNQSAQVGTALANPLVVRVLDQNGDAFSGATVNFSTTGGTLSNASVTTGSNGRASVTLTLPATPGDYTVTARVSGLTDVTFTATATAVPLVATTLEIVSGNNQSALAGAALANPLVVRVLDQNGDPLSGIDVDFDVDVLDGILSSTRETTDANGRASVTLTFGAQTGTYIVTASRTGLTDVEFTATAISVTPVATTLEIVSGNNQNAQVGTALTNPLVVRVLDQFGDPLSGTTVNFSTTGGTLSDTSVTTDANGRASVTLTLPNTAGDYTVTASATGLTNVTFTATAATEPLVATTLEIVSGNNQSAQASEALANPLVVRVLDQNGDALSGVDVDFSVNPTATLGAATVTTGSNGRASVTLTLGSTNGDYTVTASVSGLTDVTFTATATAVATTLEIVSGNNQTAQVSTALANPLVVRVLDQNGDALRGVDVGFTVSPSDGTLSDATDTTDATGMAGTMLMLGNMAGTYTVTARVSGLTDVTFTATATPIPRVATTLQIVSGNNQSAVINTALANPLVVRVLDQFGDPLSGISVSFATTGGTLSASSVTTGSNGRASVRLTLPASEGNYTVTASATGLTSVTFTATATPIINNPPEFALSSYIFIDVAIAVNTVVGTVAATDADNDPLSYTLTGTDASEFDIGSNGRITAAAALNYNETYNITVTADDGTDTTSVSVTIQTQTLSVPKLLLFEKPLNRTTTPAVAGDNDYSTYTSTNTITIAIDKAGVAQTFDTLFFKMMNVTSYIVAVDGVALPARTVPQNLTGVSELGNVPILRHGYQHDLYELTPQSGSTVEITFSGSNIQVSEVWVLKKIAALQKLNKITHSQIDRDSVPQKNLYGYDETDVITGLDRLRWRSDVELEFTHTDENYEVFMDLIEDHAEAGIVVAQEPRRLPWRTYQAIFSKLSHDAPYLSTYRPAGNTLQFVIDETREASTLWYSMDTFNSNDSGDGLMFFKPCAHLFENGAVDDNDYKTFSTQTTHTFDVDAVSHIFIKSTGVTSYQVQTYVSNAWVTQETITPVQKAYRGYDNSLTLLATRLSGINRVRLVFTGTNIKIYEVMCLDRGGEILTDTQSLLSKTDRTGIIHEGQGSTLNRSRRRASQRMKWGIGVRATFGHFDNFVVDDVLDWMNAYPNFVFSYLPNEFPWRTFPATWTDQQFQQAFLTTILQNGDYLQMNVKER